MSSQLDFLAKYREAAEKISQETGIPAERILAQAGHETGWNADTPGNNFFGIKAGLGYKGKSQTLDTTEDYGHGLQKVKQNFRAYDSPEDSFRDWANLIQSDRYKAAMQPGISDEDFAKALKAGGYATDPDYAAKLTNVIASTRTALGQNPQSTSVASLPPSTAAGAMQQDDQSPQTPTSQPQPVNLAALGATAGAAAGQPVVGANSPFSLGGSVRNGLAMMNLPPPSAGASMAGPQAPLHKPQQVASLLDAIFPKRNPYSLIG